MTKAGVGSIAGGVVVYLLAGQTQIGWLYLFDAVIWSLVLLSAIISWWSLKPLRIKRRVAGASSIEGAAGAGGPDRG